MYARSTTFQAGRPSAPGRRSASTQLMDAGIDFLRSEVVPAVQAMDGCLGMSMMANRGSGR